MEILQNEINNVNELKKEYEKLNMYYNNELDKHERKLVNLKDIYTLKKEEEIKKIEEEREILKKENLFTDFPKEGKRDEILFLKDEINKINIEIKNKEEYFKDTIDKLEKEYIETNQINI